VESSQKVAAGEGREGGREGGRGGGRAGGRGGGQPFQVLQEEEGMTQGGSHQIFVADVPL
jgi:hypothetical protein